MSVNIHKFEYWKFVMARNKEEHDEFIVDNEKLRDLVIKLFYKPVE